MRSPGRPQHRNPMTNDKTIEQLEQELAAASGADRDRILNQLEQQGKRPDTRPRGIDEDVQSR